MTVDVERREEREAELVLLTLLPGPDRKRTQSPYWYRLTYRDAALRGAGCVMAWEVSGGRSTYQVALERDDRGSLHLHCTCADAVYRAEDEGRFCKHVRGLLEFGRSTHRLLPAAEATPCCVGA
jgi:hypothetical protein